MREEVVRASRILCILLALGVLLPALAGCTTPEPPDPTPGDVDPPTNGNETVDPYAFLAELAPAKPDTLIELVEQQVYENRSTKEPRYRTPGTQGHAATIPVLAGMLEDRGLTVTRETFQAEVTELGTVNLTNIHAVREGPGDREIWLTAHWDSRAWADASTGDDCEGVGEPVLGANDGAAAVAVVIHALDLLPPTNATIHVALFDAEDQGCGRTGWAIGSKHAANQLTPEEIERIQAFILVDMPGAKELMIRREGHSHTLAPDLLDLAFSVASHLEADQFVDELDGQILDDHVAFLDRGVPAIDLIHLDKDPRRRVFPWTHHTVHDTPENLSPRNMADVTNVVVGTTVAVDRGLVEQVR